MHFFIIYEFCFFWYHASIHVFLLRAVFFIIVFCFVSLILVSIPRSSLLLFMSFISYLYYLVSSLFNDSYTAKKKEPSPSYANPYMFEKQVCSLFKFHVHHCLFMFPKMLTESKWLFLAPSFADSPLLRTHIHSHSQNPVWSGCQPTWSSSPISQKWVWYPSASQRRVRGARGHRATVCLPPSSLSPSLSLSC